MKEQSRFAPLYRLDAQNRKDLLDAVEKRIAQFPAPLLQPADEGQLVLRSAQDPESLDTPQAVVFLEMLWPVDGSPERTLQFIAAKVEEAGFDFKLFSTVKRLANGKNPYGFNGCMAAMIDFFYQLQYFKPEYDLGQIFGAYLRYSGNSVGKFKTFLSEFRQDSHYRKYSARLKALKISKLP